MKKILFVDKSFAIGGIQTSMINMINTLVDYYEVHLYLYNPAGPLRNRLDDRVKIIEPTWRVQTMGMSFSECMKIGTIKQKLFRLLATIWTKIFSNRIPISIAFSHETINDEYDLAIAYHHEAEKKTLTSGFTRFIEKCVTSERRVSWIHNDCETNPIDEAFNDKYYQNVDKIICVSHIIKENFIKNHPSVLRDKVDVCYNFLDYSTVEELANEQPDIMFDKRQFNCFSACRLVPVKGFVRAIESIADILKKYNIAWYIAGDGSEKNNISTAIKENGLEKNVILLGALKNPYSYLAQADLLILCSYFEAAPMLYSEGKYFKKPIFTTDISSSKEMLNNGEYGVICENSAEGIHKAFLELVEHREKLDLINQNLSALKFDRRKSISEFEMAVFDNSSI